MAEAMREDLELSMAIPGQPFDPNARSVQIRDGSEFKFLK